MARRSLGLVALLIAVFTTVGVVPASAATGTYLRLAHLAPDTPTVDVLVTAFSGATLRLDGVSYGDVSACRQITPGRYTLQMRTAGAPDSPHRPSSPAPSTPSRAAPVLPPGSARAPISR